MSTATEIDVAVPESETVMASDAVWRSNMSRLGDLVCVNCPVEAVVEVPPSSRAARGQRQSRMRSPP